MKTDKPQDYEPTDEELDDALVRCFKIAATRGREIRQKQDKASDSASKIEHGLDGQGEESYNSSNN